MKPETRRHGWSHQVPARRAVERDETAVAGWVKDVWPHMETPRRRSGPKSARESAPPPQKRYNSAIPTGLAHPRQEGDEGIGSGRVVVGHTRPGLIVMASNICR
ncbi:winged helix-turn-helix domain-containing protein [Streptomyces sp. ZAF1911]|nr:winged helix-turn-helix domain-containing protein [Streptomyces sp. ZAF1911]MDD9375806.1 winged helix-turn-helix domain-containing protein [Streptomyces sp. ZAF1911]